MLYKCQRTSESQQDGNSETVEVSEQRFHVLWNWHHCGASWRHPRLIFMSCELRRSRNWTVNLHVLLSSQTRTNLIAICSIILLLWNYWILITTPLGTGESHIRLIKVQFCYMWSYPILVHCFIDLCCIHLSLSLCSHMYIYHWVSQHFSTLNNVGIECGNWLHWKTLCLQWCEVI